MTPVLSGAAKWSTVPTKEPAGGVHSSLPAVPLTPKQNDVLKDYSKAEPETKDTVEQDDKTVPNVKVESETNELQNGQEATAPNAASEPQMPQSTPESAVVSVIENTDVEVVIKPTVSKETKQETEPGENSVQQEENEKQLEEQLEKPEHVLQESGAANVEETPTDSKKVDADGAPSEAPEVEDAIVPAEEISSGDLKSASADASVKVSAEAASTVLIEHADVTDGAKEEEERTAASKELLSRHARRSRQLVTS